MDFNLILLNKGFCFVQIGISLIQYSFLKKLVFKLFYS
ncbi:hypothetical protein HPLT_00850 [Helicobacter pylori Lithuania75]|nr:hypothetical protein HPLT_00850 [Helicobacter pylori Lithuania75]